MSEQQPKLINKEEKSLEISDQAYTIQDSVGGRKSLSETWVIMSPPTSVFRPTTDLSDILKFEEREIF